MLPSFVTYILFTESSAIPAGDWSSVSLSVAPSSMVLEGETLPLSPMEYTVMLPFPYLPPVAFRTYRSSSAEPTAIATGLFSPVLSPLLLPLIVAIGAEVGHEHHVPKLPVFKGEA